MDPTCGAYILNKTKTVVTWSVSVLLVICFLAAPVWAQSDIQRTALVIGVTHYRHQPWNTLRFPAKDAHDMAWLLTDPDVGGWDTENVSLLVNENATRHKFEEALARLIRECGQGDFLLVYFSGQSFTVGGRAYLALHDTNPEQPVETGFSLDILRVLLGKRSDGAAKLLILDTTHSGRVRSATPRGGTGMKGSGKRIDDLGGGIAFFSSSDSRQISQEGNSNSLFTELLLEGLRGKAKQPGRNITLADVWDYLRPAIRHHPKNVLGQTPTQGGDIPMSFELTVGEEIREAKREPEARYTGGSAIAQQMELSFWESIRDSKYPDDYRAYLEAFPQGVFATLAGNRIRQHESTPSAHLPEAAQPPTYQRNSTASPYPREASRPRARLDRDTLAETPAGEPFAMRADEPAGSQGAVPGDAPVDEPAKVQSDAPAEVPGEEPSEEPIDAPGKALVVMSDKKPGKVKLVVPIKEPSKAPVDSPVSTANRGSDHVTDVKKDSAMLLISSGAFYMGSDHGNRNETPVHRVKLGPFMMDKNEVTVRDFRAMCRENGVRFPKQPNWNQDDHPVVNVTWDEAKLYCEWAGKRLPTEAEWEVACRGGLEGKIYPWGDVFDDTKCNAGGGEDGYKKTSPAGSFPANGYGLHDMAGNVWEWCYDRYDSKYYAESPAGNPQGPSSGNSRVIRGGGWMFGSAQFLRCAKRREKPSDGRYPYIGFRCVQTSQD